MEKIVIGVILGVYVAMSAVTFLAYAVDKRAAKLGNRRIPEARLHLMELCFGWPGAFFGRRLLRHKTIKRKFTLIFWVNGVVHLVFLGAVVWWLVGRGEG